MLAALLASLAAVLAGGLISTAIGFADGDGAPTEKVERHDGR
jgi:hypothetical protein